MGGKRGRLIDGETRKEALSLIEEASKAGARKVKACELLGITLRTYERWQLADGLEDKRQHAQRCSSNKLTPEESAEIIRISNTSEYCDFPPCKIVPMLADKNIYLASESSFYRILKAENMLSHRGRSKPRTHYKPKALVAIGPNQVWSWDITYLKTDVKGLYYFLYMIVDIFSRKIVGWTIQSEENSEHAAALMQQTCLDEGICENQVALHSDNGTPMKGATMLATLEKLGVIASFSRPSVSNDNPYSEALFKTLKYNAVYPSCGFKTIDDARLWVEGFVNWYNLEHLHSALKFVTPNQRHLGLDTEILENRKRVYQAAKTLKPERWSRGIRNWDLPEKIILNPDESLLRAA